MLARSRRAEYNFSVNKLSFKPERSFAPKNALEDELNFGNENFFWYFLKKNYGEGFRDAVPLCAETDPEIFYPERAGDRMKVVDAKTICQNCELRAPCLDFALKNREQQGVWGGKSVRERKEILRKMGEFLTAETIDFEE